MSDGLVTPQAQWALTNVGDPGDGNPVRVRTSTQDMTRITQVRGVDGSKPFGSRSHVAGVIGAVGVNEILLQVARKVKRACSARSDGTCLHPRSPVTRENISKSSMSIRRAVAATPRRFE
jgi:hypothetical protein